MKRHEEDKGVVMQSLAMVMQVGLNMIVPIGMLTALGIWLDRRFDTSWITIVLFAAGAVAGAQNVYRMVKHVYDRGERGKGRDFSRKEDGDTKKGQ